MAEKGSTLNFINGIYNMLFYGVLLLLIFIYVIVKYSLLLKILIALPFIFLILLGMKVLSGVKWAKIVFLILYTLIAGFFLYLMIFKSQTLYVGTILPLVFSSSTLGIILTSVSLFKKKDESLDVLQDFNTNQ